jgi:hypothetical protein
VELMMKPLAIDLFCGLGGWSEGLLAEGWDVVGFDIERHVYGNHRYPSQLVLQDVRTLTGRQFRGHASLIVASPPCQEYSYMAMPWSRAKKIAAEYRDGTRDVRKLTELFDACFRIAAEAGCPLIVENVRGAQPWVGRSAWHYGSFHLWGDVPALMPIAKSAKFPSFRFDGSGKTAAVEGVKAPGMNWSNRELRGQDFTRVAAAGGMKGVPYAPAGHWTNPEENGTKQGGDWFSDGISLTTGSKSPARKAASAMIAKIPLPLSRHIARVFHT